MINEWIEALRNPIQTFQRIKQNPSMQEAFKYIAVAGIVSGILTAFAVFLGFVPAMAADVSADAVFLGVMGIGMALYTLFITPITTVIGFFFSAGLMFVIAKYLFKGTGDFTAQAHMMALYMAPLAILDSLLMFIPFVGAFVSFFLWFYSLYLLTMALKTAHNFTTLRAIGAWLIPGIIVFAIVVVFAIIVGVSIAAILGSAFLLGSA